MYKNKANNRNNISGTVIKKHRQEKHWSQRELSDKLMLAGLDIDKNAVQRIEAGKRFVTDIELVYIARVLSISYSELLSGVIETE